MDNQTKKKLFSNNEERKRNISQSLKAYHSRLRNHELNEEMNISFEDLEGINGITKDSYIRITSSLQNTFLHLVDMLFKRQEIANLIKIQSHSDDNSKINGNKKIFISPQQRDRIFQPDINEEEQ